MRPICADCRARPAERRYGQIGYRRRCKSCRGRGKAWRGNLQDRTLKRLPGYMPPSAGICEICGRQTVLFTDHDHRKAIVRGRLCGSCNRLLGVGQDQPFILRRAAEYLESKILA